MTQQAQSAEEKARLKKQWTDLAVKQAQQGQWEEAVTTNRNILNLFPQEPDAYNRLGKAYSELGQYTEARQAYGQTLKYSPKNTIARKNLDRLESLKDTVTTVPAGGDRIDPSMFLEETGKTGVTELINLAPASVLAHVNVGDRMQTHVNGHRLMVRNGAGEDIGQIEPRMANRLISYIETGNIYDAGVMALEPNLVRVIVREKYQHPDNAGKVSFPAQSGGEVVRAYTKDSMLRHDREEDDDFSVDDDEYYDGGDEADDITDVDFESGSEIEE